MLGPDTENQEVYILLIISVAFGLLTGYLTYSIKRLGTFIAGMWIGVILALLLNNTILYKVAS